MADERTVVRADVLRMVARYVSFRLDGGPRSTAGRLAIDDSRTLHNRGTERDLSDMTTTEVLDVIALAILRRAIYASPERRTDVHLPDGRPMTAVAPAGTMSQVIRTRSTRHRSSSPEDRDSALYARSVSVLLGRIPKGSAEAVIEAEVHRRHLVELRNQVQAAHTVAQRLGSGGKNARNLRRHAEESVAEIRSLELFESDRLMRLVRMNVYKDGLDLLWGLCTQSPERESYFFGRRR